MERSTGINTRNATEWVATFKAAEQAEGHDRVVQIISLTAGKISDPSERISISSDDSYDATTFVGSCEIGDNANLACYIQHTSSEGSCLVTPLLCDINGDPIGLLESKVSKVFLPITTSGGKYLTYCLSWKIMDTGAHKIFPHLSQISESNFIDINCYVF